jgi:hypothetical protein
MGRRRSYREEDGRLLVGARLGFGDAGADGWDSVQGHAASIRCARAAGRGGHGWRRPWGAGAARLLPRAPHGMRHGKDQGERR